MSINVLIDVLCIPGLPAELFYVREGIINEYALNFVVPVPAHIDSLHFTWQSLADKPVSIEYFLLIWEQTSVSNVKIKPSFKCLPRARGGAAVMVLIEIRV